MAATQSVNAAATAHTDVQQAPAAAADKELQHGVALPPDGLVLAETVAYRTTDNKFLSHTAGLVVKEAVQLRLVPGGLYELLVTPPGQPAVQYLLDPADWALRPASLDEIVATVHTLRAAGDTNREVLLAGELEGEDLPLYDIELKYRGGLAAAILHPNSPGPAHKLAEGQSKLVRLGFEVQQDAREWYALLAIALGALDLDSPTLADLPQALAASKRVASHRAAAATPQ